MKLVAHFILGGLFIAVSTLTFAAGTSLDANWICTTNASSSTVDTDKAADDKMAKTAGSATDSFAFASSNCRDCTEINCEVQTPTTTDGSSSTNGTSNGTSD